MKAALHREVDTRVLPAKGYAELIEASADERASLARFVGVDRIDSLTADVIVAPWGGDGVRVTGTIDAVVEQSCVVTLEPVRSEISERIDGLYLPTGSPLAPVGPDGEIMVDAEGDDPPEMFDPPMLDVGAVVTEFLSLAIDPYPRAADARLPSEATNERESPFAALAALKDGSA